MLSEVLQIHHFPSIHLGWGNACISFSWDDTAAYSLEHIHHDLCIVHGDYNSRWSAIYFSFFYGYRVFLLRKLPRRYFDSNQKLLLYIFPTISSCKQDVPRTAYHTGIIAWNGRKFPSLRVLTSGPTRIPRLRFCFVILLRKKRINRSNQ